MGVVEKTSIFHIYASISRKRYKIRPKLLLMTNIESCVASRSYPPQAPPPLLPSSPLHLSPLEAGPLKSPKGLRSTVSSPSGVWGEAPSEIEFGTFQSYGVSNNFSDFPFGNFRLHFLAICEIFRSSRGHGPMVNNAYVSAEALVCW